MNKETETLKQLCIDAVKYAHETVQELGETGISRVHVPGKNEVVTKADLAVLERWKELFLEHNTPLVVLTEESRDIPFEKRKGAKYLGVGDEIDGTHNFNRARGILPNCAIFTIFDTLESKFKDALVTAVLEHNSGNLWYAVKGEGCYFNGKKVNTSGITELGQDISIFIDRGPTPTPGHSLRYFNLEQKCWPRNISCAGVHLAGVASGSYSGWDGFLCMVQKPEELASGYLLIKEADGCLMDTNGKLLDEERFDWNKKYEIIAAATPELGRNIRKELLSKEQASELYRRIKS